MAQLMVAGQAKASSLKDRLSRQLDALALQGFGVGLRETQVGEYTVYTCSLGAVSSESPLDRALEEIFRTRVAQAVAETIVGDLEPLLLAEEVRGLKPEYDESDVADVLQIAERNKRRRYGGESLASVASSVVDYFWEQESLNLDGFVRFRLGTYRRRLKECVGDAVRKFESLREQHEFVKLLRFLMDHQDSSIDELHVYPCGGNSFEMQDRNGSSVDAEYLEAYVWDLANEEGVDREDLLISALVSLAPEKVYWHFDPWRSPLLESILGSRLEYCTGCEHCTPALN